MILAYWLDQSVWLIFTLLTAVFAVAVGVFCLLSNWRVTRPGMVKLGIGIVGPYFTAISVLLALLIGFVANDAWVRQSDATKIIQAEKANLLAIHDLSVATVSDMSVIRTRLLTYTEALIEDEWPKMTDGHSSARASEALAQLMQAVADPRHTAEAGAPAHRFLLDAVMSLRTQRGERLGLSDAQADQSKWLTLMILAGLSIIAIGLIHMEKPLAQVVSLVLFSIAIVTTLGVVALHERPFDGPLALTSAPIQSAKDVMVAARP